MNASPPTSAGSVPRPETATTATTRHRSNSHVSAVTSRPGTAASLRQPDDDAPKTAVKVAVRVRPPLDPSDPGFDLIPARFRGSTCRTPNASTLTVEAGAQGKKLFLFDRVFSDREDQEAVWDYVSESVNSFVQGYNVSLLAYGQSGAGKSYTMGTASPGEQVNPQAIGIVPRAATALFEKLGGGFSATRSQGAGTGLRQPKKYSTSAGDTKDKNWQLKATYVEIYNEQLRDLLVPDSVPAHERQPIQIREDSKGRILLTGLQQIPINSVDDLLNALNFGSSIRQTDATAINSKSSRSHAVFSLSLVLKKNQSSTVDTKRASVSSDPGPEHWVTTDSKLHFVDLAGSERLKNSGLTGERVREGISINAGLASLGKVISQLSGRSSASHVSYRDSRLTRLLQDSLGGNAITYMVACVNPVEFHLSETLNTVQYAQRARNIQSKPQIQQRAEDGDKQLVIDRLRSEVAFLRDQIRHGDRSERRGNGEVVREGRKSARENELQNQLLDIQESYSALSQRHAKLISEIAKGKGNEEEGMPELKGTLNVTSLDRLNRSNNFQEAVEAVVLEYEKTIQSLESSLSNTRSSLSTSESSLLEREARLVYLEAVTQQLNQRLRKSKDREAYSDSYLNDLEKKLDNTASGEEKQIVALKDLRKELLRVRESEESAEEYISTLEERLAEAEQDTDIMQREIRRLEHVVERQRTVGKMDNLLHELDNLRREDVRDTDSMANKHHTSGTSDMFHDRLVATTDAVHPNGEMTEESAEQEWRTFGPMEAEDETTSQPSVQDTPQAPNKRASVAPADRQSPAQSKAIADKLETVTMELFDLKVEHEATVSELDDVSRKYQIALSTLAELQDAMDEGRARPSSFLGQDGSKEPRENGGSSASRTLRSDLSSRTASPTLVEASEVGGSDGAVGKHEQLAESVRRLKRANAEKDINMAELNENFAQLSDQHQTTLKYVEELKDELAKFAKEQAQQNHHALPSPTVIRRSSSQNTFSKDRETRVYESLRHIAVEHLQGKASVVQSFEQNLTAAATESKLRNERIDALEAELKALRGEMDVKNTMISGLTRERSVRPAPSMDMTTVSTMRDHITQTQREIASLLESRATNESSMLTELDMLKKALAQKTAEAAGVSSAQRGSTAEGEEGTTEDSVSGVDGKAHERIASLQKEVRQWENRHRATMESVHASEQQLLATITSLEMSLGNVEARHAEQATASPRIDKSPDTAVDYEAEKARHVEQVTALQKEIDGYKATRDTHTAKLMQLENSYNQFMKEMEEEAKSRKLTESELDHQRELVQNLEQQIEQQKSLSEFHQSGLKSLEASHAKELDELRQTLDAQQKQSDARLTEEFNQHHASTTALQEELTKAHVELSQLMHSVAVALNDEEADAATLETRLRALASERRHMAKNHDDLSDALQKAQQDIAAAKQITIDQDAKIKELTAVNANRLQAVERSAQQEQKSSQMVQDLEEQLTSVFDSHKTTQNRLSTLSNTHEREIEEHRAHISSLEHQLSDLKRNTMSSVNASHRGSVAPGDELSGSLRKSNSQQTLPSPPPVVPLPPLPSGLSDAAPPRSPRPGDSFGSNPLAPADDGKTLQAKIDDQDNRIKTIEKHLYAEKQLTQTLEEALVDLETTANRTKAEVEGWKKKCKEVEEEAEKLRRQRGEMRNSLQAAEEEKDRRIKAEAARSQLEERMAQLSAVQKRGRKKGGGLNCF